MGPHLFNTEIVSQRLIAEDHYEMVLAAHPALTGTEPGQFVDVAVRPDHSSDPLLRRPFSLYRRLPNGDCTIVYRVVGRGTYAMSNMAEGEKISVIAPLGQGFTVNDTMARSVVVGGGVGVPPVFYLTQQTLVNRGHVTALLGFAAGKYAFGEAEFQGLGVPVQLATDDGALGHHGRVTDLLLPMLEQGKVDAVYACGPRPMLHAVAALSEKFNVPAQLAFEEVMACGVGVCLSCVIPIKTDHGVQYERVCREGPVFSAAEVSFHD